MFLSCLKFHRGSEEGIRDNNCSHTWERLEPPEMLLEARGGDRSVPSA